MTKNERITELECRMGLCEAFYQEHGKRIASLEEANAGLEKRIVIQNAFRENHIERIVKLEKALQEMCNK